MSFELAPLFYILATLVVVLIMIGLALKKHKPSPPDSLSANTPLITKVPMPWGHLGTYKKVVNNKETPILLLHGLGSSIYSWRFITDQIKDRTVHAIDLPGFGQSIMSKDLSYDLDSQAQRILDYIYREKIDRCYLMGCSMGGALSLWLSYKYPDLFPKTIAIAPATSPKLVRLNNVSLLRLAPIASRFVNRRVIRLALSRGLSKTELLTDETIEQYYKPYLNPHAATCFLKSLETIKDPRIFKSLDKRTTPTLILWGQKDNVVPYSFMQQAHGLIDHSQLEVHPWGGHHLMEDDPDWILEKTDLFLQ